MLSDHFGAYDAIANPSIKLVVPLLDGARLIFELLTASSTPQR
jgi:hypothetical protein